MKNSNFCHQFAYASNSATSVNGNMSYSYGIMYSYNTAIARKCENCVIMNTTSYSPSTSRQQSLLWQAIPSNFNRIEIEGLQMGTRLRDHEILEGLEVSLSRILKNIDNAKQKRTRERYEQELYSLKDTLNNLITYGVVTTASLSLNLHNLYSSINAMTQEQFKALELEQKEREKQRELNILASNRARYQKEIDNFKSGLGNYVSLDARKLILDNWDIVRYDNNIDNNIYNKIGCIITSQGIFMDIKEALLLYKLAKKQKALRQTKEDFNYKIKGAYRLDKIDLDGNCFVGCHKFKFEEIERCYKKEYLKRK